MQFHNLHIHKIISETPDSKTFLFEIPEDLREAYRHIPGQHLTIRLEKNGTEIRRTYSICTEVDDPFPGITVKKVKNGYASNFLCNELIEGDILDVMTPDGLFVLETKPEAKRDFYFIAAGSGITPIMSMIRTVLKKEPGSHCHLLYGSRDEKNIIFKDVLDQLAEVYKDRFTVVYVLSRPLVRKEGGFAGLFARKIVDWKGKTGRVSTEFINAFLADHPARTSEANFYLCGPGDLIERTENYLLLKNIDKKHIHKEYFIKERHESSNAGVDSGRVTVTLDGDTFDIEVPKGKTILQVLIDMKKDPPYSCTSGSCSTCMAKVKEGQVVMDACYALDDDEIAAGYILTCQSHPTTDKVVITYDE